MLDIKDKQILYLLSRDARMPAPQIAKQVHLSKDAILYRMRQLEQKKVIQKYTTVVDLKKLGYRTHIIFLEFNQFDSKTEQHILSFLIAFPYTIWVTTSSGKWDVFIDVVSKTAEQFDELLTTILNKIGSLLHSYEVLETIKEYQYDHKYLDQKTTQKQTKKIEYTLDNLDFQLLSSLSQHARNSSIELAFSLKISHDKVSYRLKKLLQSGYIQQFSILIDFDTVPISCYNCFFQFTQLNKVKENKIIHFFQSRKEVLYFAKTAGKYNFNADLIVSNASELKSFMIALRQQFGDILSSRDTFLMFSQYKNDYFPEGVLKDLLNKK